MEGTVVIYGYGGHARVLSDLAGRSSRLLNCYFDDAFQSADSPEGIPVLSYRPEHYASSAMLIAVGNNRVRQDISCKVKHSFTSLVCPTAFVAATVLVEEGTVVLAHAVIQASARIGKHVIINAGAVIDHDAVIGDFAHIGPNAYIGGGAVIGKGALIRPGSVVSRNTVIPDWEEI